MARAFGLIPTLVLLGAACGNGPTAVNQLPATVVLSLGETIRITELDLKLVFLEVVNDSRCPVDVTCVTEGFVTVRFSVIQGTQQPSGLVMSSNAPASAFGVTLRITAVQPDRRTTRPIIDPREYRVTFELTPQIAATAARQ